MSFKPLYGLLAERGMTLKGLADMMGVDRKSVYRIRKTGRCSTDYIGEMCRVLGVGVEDIIRYEGDGDDKHE